MPETLVSKIEMGQVKATAKTQQKLLVLAQKVGKLSDNISASDNSGAQIEEQTKISNFKEWVLTCP